MLWSLGNHQSAVSLVPAPLLAQLLRAMAEKVSHLTARETAISEVVEVASAALDFIVTVLLFSITLITVVCGGLLTADFHRTVPFRSL